MSNISLGGNHGHSINFDGASLQNQQEDEYRKEEEQQQNELRALLSNAFDDLIDDDDILSITSDDGTDSRNVSLVRRHSSDSLGRPSSVNNRIEEHPETDWLQKNPESHPIRSRDQNGLNHQQYGQLGRLSQTQELPRGRVNQLRSSAESLPTFASSKESRIGKGQGHIPENDLDQQSNPSRHGSRDHLDSDYQSSVEINQNSVDFHGNVYPLPGNQFQGQLSRQASQSDLLSDHSLSDRENVLRRSIEDFHKFKEAYREFQGQAAHLPETGYYANGDIQPMPSHQHYHAAEHPYDQGHYAHFHNPDHIAAHPLHHHGYDEHYHANAHHEAHHHFRNIYTDRPYHMIGDREEAEGGNVVDSMGYYHHNYQNHGYHAGGHIDQSDQGVPNYNSQAFQSADQGFFSHNNEKTAVETTVLPTQTSVKSTTQPSQSAPSGRKLPQVTYRLQNVSNDAHKDPNRNINTVAQSKSRDKSVEGKDKVSEGIELKVKYDRDSGGKRESERSDRESSEQTVETEFMEQAGSGDSQQLAQLQILYKARGRKLEELTNEMEVLKGESGRELRILKHQLSVAKGEKEGSSKSVDSLQSLLQEAKGDNAQLVGRVHACESQIEGLKKAKEELIKKLQTAESTIETLHQHLEEMGSSDTLTRARHDHDTVVCGLQKKYETEIKHLQEHVEKLKDTVQEKSEECRLLKQKLADSIQASESAQITRAETINRLTQSLEESQKRCRNLLEASSSQELSQMKIHFQQALAARTISDEMCSSLQEEIQDLKEQVQMLESASNLGVSMAAGVQSSTATAFHDQNDSMADLGIKKTLDFDTPQGTPTIVKHHSVTNQSSDVVSSLKSELERCLVSNKQKRAEVTELKEELRKFKKDMLEYKQRCERADLLTQEQKRRITDLESCLSPGEKTNAIENRLKKDIENLKREKKILLEDVEELQRRLDEVSKSEEKLTELNRELSKQISDMVKEYDQDKRQAVERAHRASEQVAETSRNKLRQELTIEFDSERSNIIAKYEKECSNLREEMKSAQDEIDRVKDEYCKLCADTDQLKCDLEKQFQEQLRESLNQVKEEMTKEMDLAKLRTEEDFDKQKETEIQNLKDEFEQIKDKIRENVQSECRKDNEKAIQELNEEHESIKQEFREKFEHELKSMKDILEMERSNDLEKLDKEKLNEIEKLKKVIIDKELYVSDLKKEIKEKEMLLAEKEKALEKLKSETESKIAVIDGLKNEYKTNFDAFRDDLFEKNEKIDQLSNEIDEKVKIIENLKEEILNFEKLKEVLKCKNEELERLKVDKESSRSESMAAKEKEIESLRTKISEMVLSKDEEIRQLQSEINKMKRDKDSLRLSVEKNDEEINKLKNEIERIEKEKDLETDQWRKDEMEREEVDSLRKEIEKNILKDTQKENETLKKEVINLKHELDRIETEKQQEVDRVSRIKQAEIENLDKRKNTELDKLRKEKENAVERIKAEKDEIEAIKVQIEEELFKLKRAKGSINLDEDLSSKVREMLSKGTEEDLNRTIETKVAMSKVVWLEEHRATRQAAIDNAVRLAESEMRMKMEEDLENKLEARLQEVKLQWQRESMSQLEEERRSWENLKEEELTSRLETKLEEAKQEWRDFELETEKLKWSSEWEQRLLGERESWIKNVLEHAKRQLKQQFEEKLRMEQENWRCVELETEKLTLLREYETRLSQERQSWISKTLPEALAKEKSIWKTYMEESLKKQQEKWQNIELPKEMEKVKGQYQRSFEEKLQAEHETWRNTELPREIDKAKDKWFQEVEGRLREERNNWKNCDLPEEIEKERRKWMKLMEQTLMKEKENWKTRDMPAEVEMVRKSLESEMETRLVKELGQEKDKLQKVNLAVEEARADWNREYKMEMSINTTSAEASQGLLKEEIERLKSQLESVQTELLDKESGWLKEKEDIILQKELERRKDLDTLTEQTESEYKQFLDEHKDMLDKALKKAREQHNQDKSELEERFNTQMKLLQAREKSLQEQLRKALEGSQGHHESLAELEKEQVQWFEERNRLLQDISDRDSLLGKADVHLSKEIDKLRAELQTAYQQRLEREINSSRQKLEAEYSRANNSEQKEKLQLEKQLSEVNSEVGKLKAALTKEKEKSAEELKLITEKVQSLETQVEDKNRLEGELKKAKELLMGFKDELTETQGKCEKYKQECDELNIKLSKGIQNQEKLQAELQKVKEDRSTNVESAQNMETSYRKEIASCTQRLEELSARNSKMEKLLKDMKHKYRTELESLRKALEAENEVAMNAMKTKMIELQKKHFAIVDELKRKHLLEKEALLKHGQAAGVGRGITPTPNVQGEVEEIDKTVTELRSQYLDTVAKIKDDVLRHITQTNVRAAETVKIEMDRERMTTFQQIKDFYRQNVRTILETELVGATLESKLLAVEEALENLSSNPSSRSTTPKSDEFILDERQSKSRSRSTSRDAGISPKGQRSVSFTSGTKGERSRTPVLNSGKDISMSSSIYEDPFSPKNRSFTKSPREMNITMRGDRYNENPEPFGMHDMKNDPQNVNSFNTRRSENRPTSAKSSRELREFDTRLPENRPLSAKSPREMHISLRNKNTDFDFEEGRQRNTSGDKKRSRTLISTRDIHSGRYNRAGDDEQNFDDEKSAFRDTEMGRAKSTTPLYSSLARSSPSLYRPISVPDLSSEDKELKLWSDNNNDTYRYTPLRDTLTRAGTNLHRNNSKSESDLSIADKNFGPLKPDYDSNLDLSTGSLASDMFMTPRKSRDAGETPTSTPRKHTHRKHYTMHSFPSSDQIKSELRNRDANSGGQSQYRNRDGEESNLTNERRAHSTQPMNNGVGSSSSVGNDDPGVNSPMSGRTSRKNLPLIQFRHGKVQGLTKTPGLNTKSPHPDDGMVIRDTPPTRDTNGTPDRSYRSLSVSAKPHMNF